ncbi:CBL-interacting serine/threonine-protein kinase 14-like [Chenopodium quinoa]|uniref:non-specific serine/threonine protein kinase n=1 Tax=Chenopodium quinoa TaxID=63459 RepID=A0A803MHT9_CHEQI|nr:CBL-interacting serine/threonine-protein kinase 14-like [Chenopodium quinoa]
MPEINNNETLSSTAVTAAEQKPVLFGKYELGRLLGRGGFAKVYHGRDLRNGKSVAVKAVSKQKIYKGNLTAHVKREVSIMRRLRHPHIIRLHEVLATKSKIFFIMDFAKGGELFAKVSKGRFSEDLSRRYFHQLISAVGYCHSRGVYHRDLKPENLLLDDKWDLKITDFGLSTVKDQTRPDEMLHTMCGTPAYVAPEILAKKGYDGAKVDIWSCGIILFVLTAGYLPFNDTNLMNLYRKIYRGEFRCPRFMSPELKNLLSHLLDVNPSNRYSIQQITDDPWFKKGDEKNNKVDLASFYFDDDEKEEEVERESCGGFIEEKESCRFLNAFDLISFSPGFNLSGLFMKGERDKENCWETFLSKEAAETVVERVEEAARGIEEVEVERMRCGMGVRVEGQNGDFGVVVEVHRLTEDLVVVQVRKREKDVGPSHEFWKEKLRPKISDLVYNSDQRTGTGT